MSDGLWISGVKQQRAAREAKYGLPFNHPIEAARRKRKRLTKAAEAAATVPSLSQQMAAREKEMSPFLPSPSSLTHRHRVRGSAVRPPPASSTPAGSSPRRSPSSCPSPPTTSGSPIAIAAAAIPSPVPHPSPPALLSHAWLDSCSGPGHAPGGHAPDHAQLARRRTPHPHRAQHEPGCQGHNDIL